MKGHLIIQLHG
jgi:hypothetical protein